jgi:hypothetical protein
MIYKYLGKDVDVIRFSNNDTAQLADGTWVPSLMLLPQIQLDKVENPIKETENVAATKKRASKSESN